VKLNDLKPELVVVTGAGSGIGRATAIRFGRLGARVVVSDIDLDAAAATAAMIKGSGGRASASRLDVTDPDDWEVFARDVLAEHGFADVLVNNAGMLVSGAFLELTPADWDRQLSVNLMGVVHGCRVFGAQMVERGQGGHIVNIASAAAFTPTPVMSAYSVSKAGVKMLTECLRLEFRPHGIGVSAICPGLIATNIANSTRFVGQDEETERRSRQAADALYRRRHYGPDKVATAVLRAVAANRAIVPVTPEAHLTAAAARLSPALVRGIGGLLRSRR
jgi:NAD(P)-dependent dehydrogenase (short-subunit alcohol dehydrogenase family)